MAIFERRGAEAADTTAGLENCTYALARQECFGTSEDQAFDGNIKAMSDSDYLNKTCAAWDSGKDCVEDFFKDCFGEDGQMLTDSQNSMADYVCGDGRAALLSEKSCWADRSVNFRIGLCKQSAQYQTAVIYYSGGQAADLCPVMQGLRTCVTGAVQQLCDSATATNFVDELYKRYLAPALEAAGCATVDDDAPAADDSDNAKKREISADPEQRLAVSPPECLE
nr:hypothetical protein BaRGS_031970 [Batillaria attramentaria]